MLPELEPVATVVVCEDDPPTLELLCDHLDADRFRTLPAPFGVRRAAALSLQRARPPAPRPASSRRARASTSCTRSGPRGEPPARYDPELPVIVLSGRATEADRVRGFAEGADDYVTKPFHYPEIAARIRAVLRRRDGRAGRPAPGR